jgi:hypothetical protein
MVIKRRDTTAGKPVRRPLGHVAVSIDDLQALIDLLAARPDVNSDVVVEFDEGHFTEGADIKELGDASLRDLRVTAGDLVVHLTDRNAEAIGPGPLVDFVHNAWSRSRQTASYPPTWKYSQKYSYKVPTTIAALFGAGIIAYIGFSKTWQLSPLEVLTMIAMAVLLTALPYLVYTSNKYAYNNASWAIIRPLTAHEVREQASRRTVVPLWSLIVSLLGLAISTTFLIIEQLRR